MTGSVDDVFEALRRAFPDLKLERLTVTHPADDDNLWFITRAGKGYAFQIESGSDGRPPFLLESDVARTTADNAAEAIDVLTKWLS